MAMNKNEREVFKTFLQDEDAVIAELENIYSDALGSVMEKVSEFQEQIDKLIKKSKTVRDPEEQERYASMIRSKIYQKKYQEAIAQQLDVILSNLHENEYATINEYLYQCYESGYAGALYSLQEQGIPLTMPINQKSVERAVTMDSKLSKGLYKRLGQDVGVMKRTVATEISRGIAQGMSYHKIARQINFKTSVGMHNATRIARTEGHRIQVQATEDEMREAKKYGANQVKQWDASLDSRTRDSHRQVDGEIRELDEKFSNGLMYPGDPNGPAAEVINCRCGLLPRARVMMDEDELKRLHERADYFGLDKSDSFEEFKDKYLSNASADFVIKSAVPGANVSKARMDVIRTVSQMPESVQKAMANTTVILNSDGKNGYDYSNDEMHLSDNADETAIIHEIGHLVENKLLNKDEVQKMLKGTLSKVAFSDITVETYYDYNENPHDIFIIRSKDFVSEYQGRAYVSDFSEIYDENMEIRTDIMLEYISEPFREYMQNPERVKTEFASFYDLFERALK